MDNNRKIRFGVIAENHTNIDYNTNQNNHTLFIGSDNHLAVKKDNVGKYWNIKDPALALLERHMIDRNLNLKDFIIL